MNRTLSLIVLLASFAVATNSLHAAVVLTSSPLAPTPSGDDIYQLAGTLSADDDDSGVWNNRPTQGQTFLTLSNPDGYLLNSITVKAFNTDGPEGYTVRIGTISGSVFTPVASDTSNLLGATANNFMTYTFGTPVLLNPNTQYAFDLHGLPISPAGFRLVNNADPSSYLNGVAYSTNDGTNLIVRDFDRIFSLDLVAIQPIPAPAPEPGSALLLGMGAMLLVVRGQRRQQG